MIRARRGMVGAATALIAAWGCDGGGGAPSASSSTEEATVQRTVTIKGVPAAGGEIQFDPANVNRKVMPRTAPIGKDGTYTIKTLVGGNSVTVRGPAIDKDLGLAANQQMVEVHPGQNTIPIRVPPAPSP